MVAPPRSQIDLRRMRYVLEVSRAQSFSTAAETLGVTQSALSRSVAEVEEELGSALFLRLSRGIELTAAGARFVSGARRILGDMETLVSQVRDSGALTGGRLRIGIAPSGYLHYIVRPLVAFAAEYPGITVETVTGTTQSLCPQLLNGELDVLVGSSSYLKRWRELELVPVTPMFFAILARRQHPLVSGEQPPREIDVLRYPWVFPQSVEPIYSDIGQRFAAHGLPPFQPRYVVEYFPAMRRIIESTDAVTTLHHPDPGFGELGRIFSLLPDAIRMPLHVLSLAYGSTRPRTAAAHRFQELLINHLSDQKVSASNVSSPAEP